MTIPTPDGMDEGHFQKMAEDYKKGIPEKISALKTHLDALRKEFHLEDLKEIRIIIHKFAGNAATFGFPNVTKICKEWDPKLSKLVEEQKAPQDPNFYNQIQALIQTLEKEFQNG